MYYAYSFDFWDHLAASTNLTLRLRLPLRLPLPLPVPRRVARKYAASWFVVDVLVVLPLDVLLGRSNTPT